MPHADPIPTNAPIIKPRPTTSHGDSDRDHDRASTKSLTTNSVTAKSITANDATSKFTGIRSKFRELGLTPSTHNNPLARQRSLSNRMHGNSNGTLNGASTPNLAVTRKQPVLPMIKTGDEFMPEYTLKRKIAALRQSVADTRVSLQILQKRREEVLAKREEMRRAMELVNMERVADEEDRRVKVDVWACRLNRRRAEDTQLWTARVAKRAPSERSVETVESCSASVYSGTSEDE